MVFWSVRTDEVLKGAAYLPEAFLDPATSHSVQPTETPWNIAFKTDKPLFVWYDEPENEERQKRFSVALAGTTKMEPADAILAGLIDFTHCCALCLHCTKVSSGSLCRRTG